MGRPDEPFEPDEIDSGRTQWDGEGYADWAEQPTEPQPVVRPQQRPHDATGHAPLWPAVRPSARRLAEAAHRRQFGLGFGVVAAVLILGAALVAALSGALPFGPGSQPGYPSIQAGPGATPTPSPTATVLPTATPRPTPTPTTIPTATPNPTPTPLPTPTANPTPTVAPTPTQAPVPTPTPTQAPAPLPTATSPLPPTAVPSP